AGTFYVSNVTGVGGFYNTCLVKLNPNGQFVWGLQDTVTYNTSYPTGIAADTAGNVYLAAAGTMQFEVPGGKGKKDATVSGEPARSDTNGNLQWIKSTKVNGTAVAIDAAGNAIVASAYYGATKSSTAGTILWTTSTTFPYADIAVDPFGNIYF